MKVINIEVTDKLKVTSVVDGGNTLTSGNPLKIASGNYKSVLLNFTFSSTTWNEVTDKYATFKIDCQDRVQCELETIGNYTNACYLPYSVSKQNCKVNIGVYGKEVEDDEITELYSSEDLYFLITDGAYNPNLTDETPVHPDIILTIEEQIEEDIDEYVLQKKNELDEKYSNYKMVYNALPKVTSSGTSIILNDTAECPMELELEPSELSQKTTTGKNLCYQAIVSTGSSSVLYFYFIKTNSADIVLSFTLTEALSGNSVYLYTDETNQGIVKYVAGQSGTRGNYPITFTNEQLQAIQNSNECYLLLYKSGANFVDIDDAQIEIGTVGTDFEEFTGGQPAPNPSYPQDVHVITGSNLINVNNRNYWDNSLVNTEGIVEQLPTGFRMTKTSSSRLSSVYEVNYPPGLYTLVSQIATSVSGGSDVNTIIRYNDGTTGYVGANQSPANFGKSDVGIKSLQFYFQPSLAEGSYIQLTNVMILARNDTNYNYEVNRNQKLPLDLPIENLFDESQLLNATDWVLNSSGYYTGGISDLRNYMNSWQPTTYKENTQYTMSYISYGTTGNSNGRFAITYTDNTTSNLNMGRATTPTYFSFTTPQGKTISKISADYGSSDTIYLKNIQLEENTHANIYTPYGTTPLEYCKIGDYADEFYKATSSDTSLQEGKWYLKKNTRKDIITSVSSVGTSSAGINYAQIGTIGDAIANGFIYCSNYINNNDATKNNAIRFAVNSLYVYDNRFTSTTIALNNLNGLSYYYPITAPTYILLNDTLQTELDNIEEVLSYQGQTNISQANSDLPLVINAKAVYDLSKLVTRVEVLESEV